MSSKFMSVWASIIISFVLLTSCSSIAPPAPYGVLPSESQLEWQKMEYYMFVHFGPNTFMDMEWGNGKENPKVFNPTDLDCRQWATTAKAAGMSAIIITAKHHDGFCLWPSAYSTHTVRESSWKEGSGDVLRELSEACKEYGLKFGVYLSPWDQNHPYYGTPAYNQLFTNTLTEVLTNYGEVFEQWFDGANGEGPNGKKQPYAWELFHCTVYAHQPGAVIFSDVGPGCRWIGNEDGYAGETNWSRLDTIGFQPGHSPVLDTLSMGNRYGRAWIPGEADTSIRPGWFYSPSTDDKVKSVAELMKTYYASVGRNANFLLNVPADRRGRIHPTDSTRLMEFRAAREKAFEMNLAKGRITATSVRGNSREYAAENLLDGRYDTYWATNDAETTGSIELDLGTPQTFNRILLQEYIPLGQRIAAFTIDYWDAETGTWNLLAEATTIGYKRILCLPTVTTGKIRVSITQSLACPVVNNLELYRAPELSLSKEDGNLIGGQTGEVLARPVTEPTVLDLGGNVLLKGFFYTPERVVAAPNISRYHFSVSTDHKSWTLLKSNAPFNNIRNNPIRQEVLFDKAVTARYIRLEAVEVADGSDTYHLVELGIIK